MVTKESTRSVTLKTPWQYQSYLGTQAHPADVWCPLPLLHLGAPLVAHATPCLPQEDKSLLNPHCHLILEALLWPQAVVAAGRCFLSRDPAPGVKTSGRLDSAGAHVLTWHPLQGKYRAQRVQGKGWVYPQM